jgi:hypothetical protein
MSRDPRYDILFEPIRIGPVTAKNRFFQVPHCNGMGHAMPQAHAAMREAKRKGARVLGICNVVGSTIARESDGGVYIHAGPEIGVASTKAFTSQVAALALLTLYLGRCRRRETPSTPSSVRRSRTSRCCCGARAVPARVCSPDCSTAAAPARPFRSW